MDDFVDFVVKPVLFIAAAVLTLVVTIAGAIHVYNYAVYRPECARFSVLSGKETYWSFGTDCLVKVEGQWVTYAVAVARKQEVTIKQR